MRTVVRQPIDLVKFLSIENEQILISFAIDSDHISFVNHIQGLYKAVMSDISCDHDDFVIHQMLGFTHYHFLFANSCLLRCHLSESYSSIRVAIDATLIAIYIINDRSSQVSYANGESLFKNLPRHYRKIIKDKGTLPCRLIPALISFHQKCSTFASHADISSFVHRIKVERSDSGSTITTEYFQFSNNKTERRIHALQLYLIFVMMLDAFSDFLVQEQKVVKTDWQQQVQSLGALLERELDKCRSAVGKSDAADGTL